MAYKVIDEELGLYSCGVGDLTLNQVESFLKLWNDGSPISTLTIFSDKDGKIVLNEDNQSFDQMLKLAKKYTGLSKEKRKKFRGLLQSPTNKEAVAVIDRAIQKREIKRELEILNHQVGLKGFDDFYGMANAIKNHCGTHDIEWLMYMSFRYGTIHGKRAERAKKGLKNKEF